MALPPSRSASPPSPPAPRKAAPWKLIASLSAAVLALLAGGLWLKGWLATPSDATVRQLLAAAVPDQLPWDVAALTAEKFANSDGTATARFTAGMRLREDLFSEIRPTEAEVAKDYPDGLGQPVAAWTGWMREKIEALEAPEREPLAEQLAERGWWSADAGRPRVNIFDRAVLKKITDAGREVTIYGTLTVSKSSGDWRVVSVSADWEPLRLGARHADREKQVVAGTDEFKAWAARVVGRGAEVEKLAADAEQKQQRRREKIARELIAEKLPGGLPWSVKTLTLTLTGGGGDEPFEAVLAAAEDLFTAAADSEVAESFAAAGLQKPDADGVVARLKKLDATEREPLTAALREKKLLAADGDGAKIFDGKKALKKTAAAGDEVTVSGTLKTKIEGGKWSAAGVEADRSSLSARGQSGGAEPFVTLGTDEFRAWVKMTASRGAEFEQLVADREEKQKSRRAAEAKEAADRAAVAAKAEADRQAELARQEAERQAYAAIAGVFEYSASEEIGSNPNGAINAGFLRMQIGEPNVMIGAKRDTRRFIVRERQFVFQFAYSEQYNHAGAQRGYRSGGYTLEWSGAIEWAGGAEYVFRPAALRVTSGSADISATLKKLEAGMVWRFTRQGDTLFYPDEKITYQRR